ncbi:MAG: hypothetical protein M3349_04735, partial [Actinomycetota bacterium]|nr:hypothetical protein [Actinomycetota bacterium]
MADRRLFAAARRRSRPRHKSRTSLMFVTVAMHPRMQPQGATTLSRQPHRRHPGPGRGLGGG